MLMDSYGQVVRPHGVGKLGMSTNGRGGCVWYTPWDYFFRSASLFLSHAPRIRVFKRVESCSVHVDQIRRSSEPTSGRLRCVPREPAVGWVQIFFDDSYPHLRYPFLEISTGDFVFPERRYLMLSLTVLRDCLCASYVYEILWRKTESARVRAAILLRLSEHFSDYCRCSYAQTRL